MTMTTTMHPLAQRYLRRLEHSAAVLPRRERQELVAEIRGHLDTAIAPDATESDVLNLLDQLGSPEQIAAAAAPDRPTAKRGTREAFAVILLVTGLPPVLGWLVGAGLLLSSTLWTGRQKLLGILVWPGGLTVSLGGASLLSVGAGKQCVAAPSGPAADCTNAGTPPWVIALWILFAVAPIILGSYLYWVAGRRAAR